MKILPVLNQNNTIQASKQMLNPTNCNNRLNSKTYMSAELGHYNPMFGYCIAHYGVMKSLNDSLQKSLNANFQEYTKTLNSYKTYMEKLEFAKQTHAKAAQVFAQYVNFQYSLAEMIPSYAMTCSGEVMNTIAKTKIFSKPQDILLTIANISKLKMVAGVDKNTQAHYTEQQARKSKANTQLYATVSLLEMLDEKINSKEIEDKDLILKMRKNILDKISAIYGKNAYERIQKLKNMGINASFEDKKASLALLQEFDIKSMELQLDTDFYNDLDKLMRNQETCGKNIENEIESYQQDLPSVVLHYHTHSHANHEDIHTKKTEHEYMHEHGIPHSHEDEYIQQLNTQILTKHK